MLYAIFYNLLYFILIFLVHVPINRTTTIIIIINAHLLHLHLHLITNHIHLHDIIFLHDIIIVLDIIFFLPFTFTTIIQKTPSTLRRPDYVAVRDDKCYNNNNDSFKFKFRTGSYYWSYSV